MPFRLLEQIGEGRFASIYKIEDKDGNHYAFKAVPAKQLKYIELDILTRLRSPYIVRSIDPKITSFNQKSGFIEILQDNSLRNLKVNRLPYIQLKRIIISAIFGLRCMHRKGYLHLDISQDNILYGKDNEENYLAYLTDFGWSVRCDDAYKGIMSTKVIKYKHTPLENLQDDKRKYSDKSDIWSLGVVILELLGGKTSPQNTGELVNNIKSINDSYIEEKIRLYNKDKMSYNEEIYLKELLINMLKHNTDERISSRDIHRLKFFKSNNRLLNLTEDCVLEKPTELVFMPYTSPHTRTGLTRIKDHYYVNSKTRVCITLEEYFLAQQVFLRLMSKVKPYLEEEELGEIVNEAIDVASNYYDRENDNGSYEIAKKLNSEPGYNYYYCSTYLEDLIILNHYLLEGNKDLLGFYNLLNAEKVFDYFKGQFEYQGRKRNSLTLEEFFEAPLPNKKDDKEVNFLTALDYHEIIEDTDSSSLIRKYKDIEKEFRCDIINHFEDRIIETYKSEELNIIEVIDDVIKDKKYTEKYQQQRKNLLAKNISKTLQELNPNFDYGIITIDTYGNIEMGKGDKKFYIVNKNGRFSLLVNKEGEYTHYYSQKEEKLKDYLEGRGLRYTNNFEYGVNSCCKILEVCILFMIYYNLKTQNSDYHLKCLDYDTIKSVLLVMMI